MGDMSGSGQRFYDDDEAEQILHRAASMSSIDGRLTYERLLETAAELGISPEAVETAEREIMHDRKENALRAEFDAKQRKGFYYHFASFLGINAGLIILNLTTSPGYLWFFWPLGGMGIGIFAHGQTALNRSSDCYQEEFAKWKAVRENRRQRADLGFEDEPTGPNVVIGVHVGGAKREKHLRDRIERAKYRLEQIERKGR